MAERKRTPILVFCNGKELEKGVESVQCTFYLDYIDEAHIVLGEGADWPKVGTSISLRWADKPDTDFFQGIVVEATCRRSSKAHEDVLYLKVLDPRCKMLYARQTQAFVDTKDKDILTQVFDAFKEDGVLKLQDVDGCDGSAQYTLMRSESPFHFVRRIAARCNRVIRYAHGTGQVSVDTRRAANGVVLLSRTQIHDFEYKITNAVPDNVLTYTARDGEQRMGTGQVDSVQMINAAQSDVPSNSSNKSTVWTGDYTIGDAQEDVSATAMMEQLAAERVQGKVRLDLLGSSDADIFKLGQGIQIIPAKDGFTVVGVIQSIRHVMDGKNASTTLYFSSNVNPV